jgi:hypothetical protein
VTLAVTGNTVSGQVFRRYRVTMFQWHRLLLTGSRRDIPWGAKEKRRGLSVYFLSLAWRLWKSVVTLAVSGIIFPVGFSALQGVSVSEASTAVDQISTGRTVGEL